MARKTFRRIERGIRRYEGPDGKGSYHVQVVYMGKTARGSAPTLARARDLRTQLEADLRAGAYQPEARGRTVRQALARYYRSELYLRLSHKEQKGREITLGWWEDRIGHLPLAHLHAPVVADLRDELLDLGYTASTVNRYLSHFSRALRPALERGWLPANPVAGVLRPKPVPVEGEILTDDEVRRLLLACKQSDDRRLRYLVPCLLSCGARISEYMATRHQDVDVVRGTSLLRDTKSGRPRVLRYHGHGLLALREAMKVRSITGYLWASDGVGGIWPPRKPMYRALEVAEIDKPGCWHLLRRTSATWLAAMGASERELREHLGHADASPATARYVQLGQVTRSALAERFVQRRLRAA